MSNQLPPYPTNPTPLQKVFHDYLRGLATYSQYKQAIEHAAQQSAEQVANKVNPAS